MGIVEPSEPATEPATEPSTEPSGEPATEPSSETSTDASVVVFNELLISDLTEDWIDQPGQVLPMLISVA